MEKSLKEGQHGGKREGAGRKPELGEARKLRTFKATDDEWAEIKTLAAAAGMTASEYIRYCALKQ